MKKVIAVVCLILAGLIMVLNYSLPADAAKKSKAKGGLNETQLQEIRTNIETLTKKYYSRELYTPSDSDILAGMKITLDSQMDNVPDPTLAPLYYRIGTIYKLRGMKNEAILCFQTVLENFSDTAYGPKARADLISMGVEIKEEVTSDEDEEEE